MKKLVLAAAVALTGLVLTACTDKQAPVVPAASSNAPVRGGQLVVALRAEPSQLNPLVDQGSGAHSVRPVVDSLVWANADGSYDPWLAERWEVSDDASRYVFHLRKDVKFHDGTPLNAEAVKANFDYVLNPANKST